MRVTASAPVTYAFSAASVRQRKSAARMITPGGPKAAGSEGVTNDGRTHRIMTGLTSDL